MQGYQYCDLLLSQGRFEEVLDRAQEGYKVAERNNWLLDMSLDNLSLGRAYLKQAIVEEGSMDQATEHLNRAVAGLREAGTSDLLPRGLIARAEFYRINKQYDLVRKDLTEAREISERGDMKLYLISFELECGRLALAEGNEEQARNHRQKAAAPIEETGIKRYLPDLDDLPM